MASFGINEAEQYGGQGGGGYFSLKNDKDTARVRFLYTSADDITGYSVHEVKHNGKKRYVNCLRKYGDPLDMCPMCASGSPVRAKYFVPLYNTETEQTVVWERGKEFGKKLASLCARYPNLVSHEFEIERNGQAGSKDTRYEVYEVGHDNDVTIDDFEVENPIGGLILDKDVDEMNVYIETGAFPDVNDGGSQPLPRRGERRTPNGEGRRQVF